MNISNSEYEQPRSVFQLREWINSKLRNFEQDPAFGELYFVCRGQNIKKLLEEAVPVARLGLYLWRPWRDVSVTCLAENRPHDAEVTLQDPQKTESIEIDVTGTETDETTMRRQALARDGFVWMTGPVRRKDRKIVSEAPMVDLDKESVPRRVCSWPLQEKADSLRRTMQFAAPDVGPKGVPQISQRNLICRCSCRLRTDCLLGRKVNSPLDWE